MISKQIEQLRRKNGWSQAELARHLHISPSAVGMYEQGRRTPSIDILVALSESFGVTLDYLVAGKECTSAISEPHSQTDQANKIYTMLKHLSREELMILLVTQLINPT